MSPGGSALSAVHLHRVASLCRRLRWRSRSRRSSSRLLLHLRCRRCRRCRRCSRGRGRLRRGRGLLLGCGRGGCGWRCCCGRWGGSAIQEGLIAARGRRSGGRGGGSRLLLDRRLQQEQIERTGGCRQVRRCKHDSEWKVRTAGRQVQAWGGKPHIANDAQQRALRAQPPAGAGGLAETVDTRQARVRIQSARRRIILTERVRLLQQGRAQVQVHAQVKSMCRRPGATMQVHMRIQGPWWFRVAHSAAAQSGSKGPWRCRVEQHVSAERRQGHACSSTKQKSSTSSGPHRRRGLRAVCRLVARRLGIVPLVVANLTSGRWNMPF